MTDRFIQNLRRFLGYDVQYFAAVEPQRRLAPHIHLAIRGTVSRAELRRVLAATYHQVWWPDTSIVRFDGEALPALRYEPCSPRCANWLRLWHPAQERPPRLRSRRLQGQGPSPRIPRLRRAPRPGLPQMVRQDAGRPPGDRKIWLTAALGMTTTDPARCAWEPVTPGDPDHTPGGSCTSSPTASNGKPPWLKPDAKQAFNRGKIFRHRGGGMTNAKHDAAGERLLTVSEAAEILRTSERFPCRLIAERRIRFVRVGRHVRIPESALREFIAVGLVEPLTTTKKREAA